MMTWQHLKDLKRTEYEEAADGWGEVSSHAYAAKERVENEMLAKLRDTQTAQTADAALGDLSRLARNFQYIHAECGLVRTALNGFAAEVATPQSLLKAALEDAEGYGFTVHQDGSVSYPAGAPSSPYLKPAEAGTAGPTPGGPLLPGARNPLSPAPNGGLVINPNKAKAEGIAQRIASACRTAAEIDSRYRTTLSELKVERGLRVDDKVWADAAKDLQRTRDAAGKYLKDSDIPHGKSPAENTAWWNGLNQEQRDEYISLYPASVGALDGIPSEVRDTANRVVLAETHGTRQVELDAWRGKEPPRYEKYISPITGREVKGAQIESKAWKEWDEKRKEMQGRLDGMQHVQDRLTESEADKRPEGYLLGFADTKNGQAIVSIGNPDTADNVVTYVPGTYSTLAGIGGDLQRAELLRAETHRQDPDRQTASILWLGYEAPQSIVPEAASDSWANDAKEPLSRFLTGVDTAHTGGPVNSTVLGHSYGTLVAGKALAENPDLPVDNVVFVGSPGVGVDHAKDLGVPPDKVWAATADHDLINWAPSPNAVAGAWLGPLYPPGLIELLDDHSILYGTDPSTDDFGGRTFGVAPGKSVGEGGELMPAHSQYWEDDSLRAMGGIVTGKKS
ncbi:alpha/beta hydrolase [Streptomyces sp. NBC_01408]|uniref:alpha/beta hydrolase n=1 Tax=Streptomyces sp. NBC_01408 TaxID=2903855 RepID=UPI00224CE7D4|nr:alpha/beta hydrolase [Streptomyces sp. NBC_01408]MCX4691288.1 alpha/beta hydrolase family protein [Streptomyces sp. NBC_01408]